ncbi:nicotinate-nucleotide--dimethylbenzimidazole phosphoribosyltransferase [Kitasatospora sp. NPDC006697]|uniref:nicotinate-nucleotide--dimethylbenzimidazole phosphoribosyltransferase n=1 Tax=Kitasatospora sp. NPDC006697 TaxID=3364020 RepID=UPI00369A8BFC
MTDGGHVPSEGRPEHLLPGTGHEPAQGGGGWGGDPVGQSVPGGHVPVYTFIDQPDDDEDVLLMPGPQSGWVDPAATPVVPLGDALTAPAAGGFAAQPAPGYPVAEAAAPLQAVPVAQPVQAVPVQAVPVEAAPQAVAPVAPVAAAEQPPGTPVEPSWPPVTPPGYADQSAPAAPAPGVVPPLAAVAPVAEPVAAVVPVAEPAAAAAEPAAQQRRPLHAGPPIPDPSLMTGQVPVRSLADRGPAGAGGTPPHGVPVVVLPTAEPGSEATLVLPVQQAPVAAEAVVAAPPAVEPVPAPAPVVEQAVPLAEAAEPVAVAPVVAEPVAVEPVAVEPVAVQPEAVRPAPVQEAPAQPAAPAQAAPGQPRRIAAFLADPAPLGLAVVDQVPAAAPAAEPEAPAQPTAEEPAAVVGEPVAQPVAESAAEAAVEPVEPVAAAEAAAEAQPDPAVPIAPAATEAAEQPAAPVAVPGDAAEPAAAAEQPVEPEGAAAAAEPAEPEVPRGPAAPGYDEAARDAVHQVMRERRDIRNGFRPDPVPHEVLLRVLEAAHTAPSVGYSQPWDFVVIRSTETRRKMHALAERQREAYADSLPKGRAKQFREIKIEAILDTPVNIVVTADRTRGGRHTLGRHTQPQMAPYSAALAVENLWLAARAEGLGVGWVSFFDEEEMVRELGLPEHLDVVAYLCIGFVDAFPDEPELQQQGWAKKRPLSWVVHEEQYGNRALPGEEPHSLLSETLRTIRPLDAKALGEAWDRQKRMTKPAGSLGMLEIISAQLSGLSRKCPPPIPEPACVAIFAGDHGVHAQGVTPWPQEVTAQMVANFLAGGAVVNSFAAQVGAEVCVVDVGVKADLPDAIQQGRTTGLLPRKVKPGTDDMTQGPAMSREEALKALETGIETARDLVAAGNKILITGDMGIANTTASAALISVFTGTDPAEVTGRGTGIDDETHARKVAVIRTALELHQPDPTDPIGVLAAVGGLEHAAIAGFLLGAASLRTPVILDGVIAGSAALVAKAIAPEVLAACIAGHRSAEPGHQAALAKIGLRPLIDLDLRLGEGTGALLALPLVQSAARAMHDVATFDSAGVTEKG